MAADTCKSIMNTALFAGTVFKGAGTHPVTSRAVKISHFAQSAGNFSTSAEGSSETTRVDPLCTFSEQLGKLIDRGGYFHIDPKGKLMFQLTLPPTTPLLSELQPRFGAKVKTAGSNLV